MSPLRHHAATIVGIVESTRPPQGGSSEDERVDADEEGGEAQHKQRQILIVVTRRSQLLGLRHCKASTERVAGGGSRKGEVLSHVRQLTPRLRFGPARI